MTILFAFVWPQVALAVWLSALQESAAWSVIPRTNSLPEKQ